MRRVLTLLIFALLTALVLAPGAAANNYSDSVGAAGNPGCHTGCAGGSGQAPWFDIANIDDESLSWPSTATLDTYRCQVNPDDDNCTTKRSAIAIAKTVTDWIVNTKHDKTAIWTNNCQDGFSHARIPKAVNTDATGCLAPFNASTFRWYGEIHGTSPEITFGGNLNTTVAWNIQVWREGSAAPIFERRVGLGGGNDSDTRGTTNKAWWYGGINKRFSGTAAKAGPLGPISASDHQQCLAHKKTITGKSNVQIGRQTCIWRIPNSNKKEWISITWNTQGGSGSLSYTLHVPPKSQIFYAVHVAAIDGREQLMPGHGASAFLWPKGAAIKPNFFKVYMPDISCTKVGGCDPPKNNSSDGAGEPEPLIGLLSSSPTPTRVQTDNKVSVMSSGTGGLAAVFPWSVRLIHFTPQSRYNGVGGSPYASDYVTYDQNNIYFIAPPGATGALPQRLASAKSALLEQPALITQPPIYDPLADPSLLSVNNFGISWLRPTLVNPCPQKAQDDNKRWASQQGTWPARSSQCIYGNNVARDAWDDYLEASTIYESRWVLETTDNNQPIGWIIDSPLRCSESAYLGQRVVVGGGGTGSPACASRNTFVSYSGSAVDNTGEPIGTTQRVQGFVHPGLDDLAKVGKRGAGVGIKIKSNRLDLIGSDGFTIWDRDTLDITNADGTRPFVQSSPAVHENTVLASSNPTKATTTRELWFCSNGIPRTAVYNGTTYNVKLDLLDHDEAYDDLRVADIDPLASVRKTNVALPTSGASPYTDNNPRNYSARWRFKLVGDSLDASGFSAAADAASADGAGVPGDGCGGYVVRWQWGARSGQADVAGTYTDTDWYTHWGVCGYNQLSPPKGAIGGTNKRTTDLAFYTSGYNSSKPGYPNDQSDLKSIAAPWGRYSNYGGWPVTDAVDLRPLLKGTGGESTEITVPYIGKRPGQVRDGGANSSDYFFDSQCHKTMPGHYRNGSWSHVSNRTVTTTVHIPERRTCPADPSRPCQIVPAHDVVTTVLIPQFAWVWNENAYNCRPSDTGTIGNHPKGFGGTQIFPDNAAVVNGGHTNYGQTAMPSVGGIQGEIAPTNDPWGSSWSCQRQVGNSGVDIPTNRSGSTSKADSHAYVLSGDWVLAQYPGDGWGMNQTGPALPVDNNNGLYGYMAQFVFTGLSPTSASSVTWDLTSSYTGHQRWQWMSHWQASDPADPANDGAAQTVEVYGTRLTR